MSAVIPGNMLTGRKGVNGRSTPSQDQEASGPPETNRPALMWLGLVISLVLIRVLYDQATPI